MKVYYFLFGVLILIACQEKKGTVADTNTSVYFDPIVEEISNQINQSPENDELLFKRAEYFYGKEKYEDAINDMTQTIRLDSLKPHYYHLLADAQLDYFRSSDALNTLIRAKTLFPKRIKTLLKLAEFQLILKQYDDSIITVNEILANDPQNAEAYFMLGMNFRALKDTTRAINSFQRCVELDADLVDAWILLGNLYEAIGDPLAKRYYQNAVFAAPENIAALHSNAFYLQNHDNIPDALEMYERIHLIDPKYEDAFLNAGILYLEMDSFDRAWEQFNILTGINPASAYAYYYRGIAEEMRNNINKAAGDYQNALNIQPNFLQASQALENLNK